jgi:hypothetical protein
MSCDFHPASLPPVLPQGNSHQLPRTVHFPGGKCQGDSRSPNAGRANVPGGDRGIGGDSWHPHSPVRPYPPIQEHWRRTLSVSGSRAPVVIPAHSRPKRGLQTAGRRLGTRGSSPGRSQADGLRGLHAALWCVLLYAPAAQAGYLDVTWHAPTAHTDGSPLDPATDLSGYRVYVGSSSTGAAVPPCKTGPIPIGNQTTYRLAGLGHGSAVFVQGTAVATNGAESACSNEASGITHADGTGVAASGSSSDAGGGGGCFIATAAYGSPVAREVQLLREFRDRNLLPYVPGRLLVALYTTLSPPLARAIAQSHALRGLVRIVLRPVLWWVMLFSWSPALALGVLRGTPLAIPSFVRRFASGYNTARRDRLGLQDEV